MSLFELFQEIGWSNALLCVGVGALIAHMLLRRKP